MKYKSVTAVNERDGITKFEEHIRSTLDGNTSLVLPTAISHGGALGRSIALTQLVATWAHVGTNRWIQTKLPVDDDDAHERFVSRIHGLAAAYFAEKITAGDGCTDLRRKLLRSATPRILAMDQRRYRLTTKGLESEFVFVHSAKNQFHSVAYERNPTVAELMDPQDHGNLIVRKKEMSALVREVLREFNQPRVDLDRLKQLFEPKHLPVGTMLYETFRNTAEHAYLDNQGRIPLKGIRSILIAHRSVETDQLSTQFLASVHHPQIDTFFRQLQLRAGSNLRRKVHLLELSVLDSGPGFIATMNLSDSSGEEDAERVASCFRDGVTSKPGPNSGLGLGNVLKHIYELNGFLRVRTSTTESFYSSLTHRAGKHYIPHVVGELPRVVGTAITIAIPLEV